MTIWYESLFKTFSSFSTTSCNLPLDLQGPRRWPWSSPADRHPWLLPTSLSALQGMHCLPGSLSLHLSSPEKKSNVQLTHEYFRALNLFQFVSHLLLLQHLPASLPLLLPRLEVLLQLRLHHSKHGHLIEVKRVKS